MKPAIGDDAPTQIRCRATVKLELVDVGGISAELRVVRRNIGETADSPPEMVRMSVGESLTFEMPVTYSLPAGGKVVTP